MPDNKPSVLKRLLSYSLPHKARFLGAFTLLAMAVGAEMMIPWLTKIILDEVIITSEFEWQHLMLLTGAVMVFYVISSALTYWQAVAFRHGALLVVNDIRQQLFRHVLMFPISRFDSLPTGKLVSYITHDTEAMRNLYVSTIPTIIQGGLKILAIFIAIALLDWRLMLLTLVLIPVLLLIMHLYRTLSMPVFDGVRNQVSNINSQINESIQGMDLIQSFRQQSAFKQKFERENQQWLRFRNQSIAMDSLLLNPLTRLVSTLTTAGIVFWFAGASLESVITVGSLYAFLNYIERFFDPFRQLSMELRKLQVATVSSQRVLELLDEESQQQSYPTEQAPVPAQPDIEFRNVHFGYEPGNPVLKDISFTVKAGTTTAIVGHTGSGKSSVINLLMRFYTHQAGSVLIGGQPIESLAENQLRQLIGLVSQDPTLFSGSITENIDLTSAKPDQQRAMLAARKVKADQFIQQLTEGFEHQPTNGGVSFSVGEKQLLALARGLSHNPEVFLLDEATANIDSNSEEAVKEALNSFQDGKTVISVAHRLSTIKNADQILVMNQGRIVQRGNHAELIGQQGDYRDLYLAQKTQEEQENNSQQLGLTDAAASNAAA